MKNRITLQHSVLIKKSPVEVWDFTQDFEKRNTWDITIDKAYLTQEEPRQLRVLFKTSLAATFQYKMDERPMKTSVAITETNSNIVKGGGGSWQYQATDAGTLWTQTNTVLLKKGLLGKMLRPFMSLSLAWAVKRSMQRAKLLLEQ